jgi:hypothetical protein
MLIVKERGNKTMKKIIIILCLLVSFALVGTMFAMVINGKANQNTGVNLTNGFYYPLTTKVVKVDYQNDMVICEDFNGNQWSFEGCEDWAEGDIASLLMNSHGTQKIYDDEIVTAKYSGYFEGWN